LVPILIVGHTDNSITTSRYDSGEWELEQHTEIINKIPVHK
jgi:hypothetical protein